MFKTIVAMGAIVLGGDSFALTLEEYLAKVQAQSLAYKGNTANADGSKLVSREADLITSPVFFASAKKAFDGKMLNPPAGNNYDDLNTDTYSLGVSQKFDFGLEAKFSYSLKKTDYDNPRFDPGTQTKFWDLSPSVELTMPLWANGFGRTIEANKEVIRSQNKVNEYNSLYQSQTLLTDAESTYWRLSTAIEKVAIQEAALKAGQNIYNYVEAQRKRNLGESADVLQARALTEAYQLQLQQAINERESAKRAFNNYLNVPVDSAPPALDVVNYNELDKFVVPAQRPGERLDLVAARAQAAYLKASSDLIAERNKPSLDVIGGYTMNGRGVESSKAFENANKTNHDEGYVGVVFQIPLNFKATSDAKAGAERLKDSAEFNVQNLTYTQEQDWSALKDKLEESKSTLRLARTMETAQKLKLENERSRLRQGRTTTYQVLLFEQDFTAAQASRVQAVRDIVTLQTQVKLYQTAPDRLAGDK